MKHFNKILCPYDFSEYADEALLYAIKLADTDTEVHLLNVIQLPYLIDPNGYSFYDMKADEIKKNTEDAMQKKLNELKEKYPTYLFISKIETNDDPTEAIIKTQKDDNMELVVIGSHGRKGLDRLLMGSVAESVLRGASCPVLIIKHK